MAGSRLNELIDLLNEIDVNAGDLLISSHQSCTSILVLWLTGEDILIPSGSLLCLEVSEIGQGKGEIAWQESPKGEGIKRATSFVDQF
jgi:phosphohistidine phosphatase SixA